MKSQKKMPASLFDGRNNLQGDSVAEIEEAEKGSDPFDPRLPNPDGVIGGRQGYFA